MKMTSNGRRLLNLQIGKTHMVIHILIWNLKQFEGDKQNWSNEDGLHQKTVYNRRPPSTEDDLKILNVKYLTTSLVWVTYLKMKDSAHLDGGPRSRVCACKSLRWDPHQPDWKFFGTHVCRVTFKHLPILIDWKLSVPGFTESELNTM